MPAIADEERPGDEVRVVEVDIPSDVRLIERVVELVPDLVTMGGLTIISNVYGNPAVSIPAARRICGI